MWYNSLFKFIFIIKNIYLKTTENQCLNFFLFCFSCFKCNKISAINAFSLNEGSFFCNYWSSFFEFYCFPNFILCLLFLLFYVVICISCKLGKRTNKTCRLISTKVKVCITGTTPLTSQFGKISYYFRQRGTKECMYQKS